MSKNQHPQRELRVQTGILTSRMAETHATAYDSKIEGNVIFTRFDAALNWVRKNSLWPMPMGLACCAIELMATAASRFDISRFGAEVMRFSPRQCDVMIVAGTVTSGASSSHGTKRETENFEVRRKHSPLIPSFQKFSVFERFLANFASEFPEDEGEKWQHLQPRRQLRYATNSQRKHHGPRDTATVARKFSSELSATS